MIIEDALQSVDEIMFDVVESDVQILTEASRHIISAGGKRIRPQVLFWAFLASGGRELNEAVPVAAAVELVHTATLVHDDINDHGQMRRGRVTINEKWGRTFALLTGDFLFTKVYELMGPYRDLNITLSEATVALVEGETLQAEAAKHNRLNRETYQKVVAKKTASLFRAAAMLGGQLADADDDVVETLGEYGFYVGLIFQIIDDLLDLTGDPRLMGKSTGVDVQQGKGVAVASNPGNGRQTEVRAATAELVEEDNNLLEIKRQLIADGAVEEGQEMARALSVQAHAALDKLPDDPAVEEMRKLITLVLERDR